MGLVGRFVGREGRRVSPPADAEKRAAFDASLAGLADTSQVIAPHGKDIADAVDDLRVSVSGVGRGGRRLEDAVCGVCADQHVVAAADSFTGATVGVVEEGLRRGARGAGTTIAPWGRSQTTRRSARAAATPSATMCAEVVNQFTLPRRRLRGRRLGAVVGGRPFPERRRVVVEGLFERNRAGAKAWEMVEPTPSRLRRRRRRRYTREPGAHRRSPSAAAAECPPPSPHAASRAACSASAPAGGTSSGGAQGREARLSSPRAAVDVPARRPGVLRLGFFAPSTARRRGRR